MIIDGIDVFFISNSNIPNLWGVVDTKPISCFVNINRIEFNYLAVKKSVKNKNIESLEQFVVWIVFQEINQAKDSNVSELESEKYTLKIAPITQCLTRLYMSSELLKWNEVVGLTEYEGYKDMYLRYIEIAKKYGIFKNENHIESLSEIIEKHFDVIWFIAKDYVEQA